MRITRRKSRLLGIVLGLSALAASIVTASSASALAARGTRPEAPAAAGGYLWYSGTGPLNPRFAYDSADSAAGAVTESSSVTGEYFVQFAKMPTKSTVAQVTSYRTSDFCVIAQWGESTSGAYGVSVDCYTSATGTPQNAPFTLVVAHADAVRHGVFDYSFDYQDNKSGPLTLYGQYNSSHKKNSVKLLGTGKYQVTLGGPKTKGTQGVVKLTGIGATAVNCELQGWTGSAKGELVDVGCYGAGHVAQDSDFVVTYSTASNLMGISGQVAANALADGSKPLYQPTVQYDSIRGARITVVHYSTGLYEVLPVGSSGDASKWGGDVQVNAVNNVGRNCVVESWGQQLTPSLLIGCYDQAGQLVNSPFAVEWMVP